jgi:hypothetical protein
MMKRNWRNCQCRGPFLSSVARAIGEIFGGSSMPPQGLHSQGSTVAKSRLRPASLRCSRIGFICGAKGALEWN